MNTANPSTSERFLNAISWLFSIIFIVTGVLNLILVHPVPGSFYLLISVFYLPAVNTLLKKKTGFAIPYAARIIFGFLVLWGTLAVGDLAEILGL
ncbi:MAG TPA: hypothetical protein VEB60_03400 [Candidatus Paceibacterota bacterium]|nr:hypothetical protein [Candidatus Paceibacterota bacterium]